MPYQVPQIKKMGELTEEKIAAIKKAQAAKETRKGSVITRKKGIVQKPDLKQPGISEVVRPQPSTLNREKYYGHEYERDLLHGIEINTEAYLSDFENLFLEMAKRKGWSTEQARAEAQKNFKERGLVYLDFPAAVKLVKKHQPWQDPTEPDSDKSRFGHDLRTAIVEELDLAPEQAEQVRFFVAASREKKSPVYYRHADDREVAADLTPLDYYHGTDCFIEIGGDEEKIGDLVLLDVTLDRKKRNDRAIVVPEIDLPQPNSSEEEVKAYYDFVEGIAKEVISHLSKRTVRQLTQH